MEKAFTNPQGWSSAQVCLHITVQRRVSFLAAFTPHMYFKDVVQGKVTQETSVSSTDITFKYPDFRIENKSQE